MISVRLSNFDTLKVM